jgi:polyhydroxyalkanoate synthesis regulator phasin
MARQEVDRTNRKRSAPLAEYAKEKASGLSRMEAEGGKLIKGVFDFLDLRVYEERLEAAVQEAKRAVDDHLRKTLSRLDIATKTEVKELKKAVDKLRKDVNKLANPSPRKAKGVVAGT